MFNLFRWLISIPCILCFPYQSNAQQSIIDIPRGKEAIDELIDYCNAQYDTLSYSGDGKVQLVFIDDIGVCFITYHRGNRTQVQLSNQYHFRLNEGLDVRQFIDLLRYRLKQGTFTCN